MLYICGVPGTGKTACVMEVINSLRGRAQQQGVQVGRGGLVGGPSPPLPSALPAPAPRPSPLCLLPPPAGHAPFPEKLPPSAPCLPQLVTLNALSLPSPQHIYSKLWERLTGSRAGPARAALALEELFSGGAKGAGMVGAWLFSGGAKGAGMVGDWKGVL